MSYKHKHRDSGHLPQATKNGAFLDLNALVKRDRDRGNSVGFSLLSTYARCLALKDPALSWEAQRRFHECQLSRERGGTMSHNLGYQLKAFLEDAEAQQ